MIKKILRWYFKTSLILRIIVCFIGGSLIGAVLWYLSPVTIGAEAAGPTLAEKIIPYISPFGQVFVHMLKMIVVPIIFFSLVVGASSLPIKRFGRIGLKTILWYLFCSFVAAILGTGLALVINPGSGLNIEAWQKLAGLTGIEAEDIAREASTEGTLSQLLLNLFRNPFEALAAGNFLPIIVFAIMFGLAIRVLIEAGEEKRIRRLELLSDFQVSIPEIGTKKATNIPFVVLTSNNYRDMSDALKRRCIHIYIEYPERDLEMRIVTIKIPGISQRLAGQVVDAVRSVRSVDLKKKPCISETLDWARSLIALNVEDITPDVLVETLSMLCKYRSDAEAVRIRAQELLS